MLIGAAFDVAAVEPMLRFLYVSFFFAEEDDFGVMCRRPSRPELMWIFVRWMIQITNRH